MHRSLLEAIAYGFRRHLDVFAEDGLSITTTFVTNGGSRSALWREMLADVMNRDVVSIVEHPGSRYGAAVVAGVGVGLIGDWTYVAGRLATRRGHVADTRATSRATTSGTASSSSSPTRRRTSPTR